MILVLIVGRKGSMSYNFIKDEELFLEGVQIIQGKYFYYDKNHLKDKFSGKVYSIEMVREVLKDEMFYPFLRVLIFDALIGNSDRHHSNWGLIFNRDRTKVKFTPLYDNGSSLCAYVEEKEINLILKDSMRFEALINTKSKSAIGFNNIRPVRQFDLVEYIKENYYSKTINLVNKINENITENNIDKMLANFDEETISIERKKLLKIFLNERKNRIAEIYGLGAK